MGRHSRPEPEVDEAAVRADAVPPDDVVVPDIESSDAGKRIGRALEVVAGRADEPRGGPVAARVRRGLEIVGAVAPSASGDRLRAAGERRAGSAVPAERAAERFWQELRRNTQSRIGLGRAGDALPTARVLEFRAAHAAARDAVHLPLDVAELGSRVGELGMGEVVQVRSRVNDRAEYLRRPDLGRLPADGALAAVARANADIGFVLADGLSPRALTEHGVAMLAALLDELGPHYSIAPPVIATQARVALGDHIAAAMGVRTLVLLIGERPGLSVADSLGIYLTHLPYPGRTDADRNCVSNIHPPEGLGYAEAAKVLAGLVSGARELGRSGVELKDTSRADALGATADSAAVSLWNDPPPR